MPSIDPEIEAGDPKSGDTAFRVEESPSREDVEAYAKGVTHTQLVWDYLQLERSSRLADRAACMAPSTGKFDARQLINQAAELQSIADEYLWKVRMNLASRMNFATLKEAARRLKVPYLEDLGGMRPREFMSDRDAGPIVRCLVDRDSWTHRWMQSALGSGELELSYADHFREFFSVDEPTEVVAMATNRLKVPRPEEPCSLSQGLRWVAEEWNLKEDCLLAAFLDLLRTTRCEPGVFRPWESGLMNEPDPPDQEHVELDQFRKSFRPGDVVIGLADFYADLAFRQFWNDGPIDDSELAWLYTRFRVFWKAHRAFYVGGDPIVAKKSKVKSEAALAKHAKDARARCLDQIRKFFEYLAGSPVPDEREERRALFAGFVNQAGVGKSPQRREEARELLEILYSSGDEPPSTLWNRLKRSRLEIFNALPELERQNRIDRMKKTNQGKLRRGGIPDSLEAFVHLGEDGSVACREAWERGIAGVSKQTLKKRGK